MARYHGWQRKLQPVLIKTLNVRAKKKCWEIVLTILAVAAQLGLFVVAIIVAPRYVRLSELAQREADVERLEIQGEWHKETIQEQQQRIGNQHNDLLVYDFAIQVALSYTQFDFQGAMSEFVSGAGHLGDVELFSPFYILDYQFQLYFVEHESESMDLSFVQDLIDRTSIRYRETVANLREETLAIRERLSQLFDEQVVELADYFEQVPGLSTPPEEPTPEQEARQREMRELRERSKEIVNQLPLAHKLFLNTYFEQ